MVYKIMSVCPVTCTAVDVLQDDVLVLRNISVPISSPHLFERFGILPVKASVYCGVGPIRNCDHR